MIHEELGLSEDQNCLPIYDVFKVQTTGKYCEHLDENNIGYVQVSPNLTHIFQSLVLNVSSFAKSFLKSWFEEWYAEEVTNDLKKREKITNKMVLIPSYQKLNRYMRNGGLVCMTSCEIPAKWSNQVLKMLHSWRQLTARIFLMRIHLSPYLNRNIFYDKRNYLNYLNYKSYVVPFFFHFPC